MKEAIMLRMGECEFSWKELRGRLGVIISKTHYVHAFDN